MSEDRPLETTWEVVIPFSDKNAADALCNWMRGNGWKKAEIREVPR